MTHLSGAYDFAFEELLEGLHCRIEAGIPYCLLCMRLPGKCQAPGNPARHIRSVKISHATPRTTQLHCWFCMQDYNAHERLSCRVPEVLMLASLQTLHGCSCSVQAISNLLSKTQIAWFENRGIPKYKRRHSCSEAQQCVTRETRAFYNSS